MKVTLLSLTTALFAAQAAVNAQNFETKKIRDHITFLASDKLEGRGTGSKGEAAAADYISKQFQNFKLRSFGGDYKRPFSFQYNPNPHDTSSGKVTRSSNNVVG